MTDFLNPETLRALRDHKRWSQEQLAAEAQRHGSISKTQIARWEASKKPIRLRKHSRDVLCQTLGVQWEVLTRPPEKEKGEPSFAAPLKLNVSGTTLTALELVARIYRVSWEDIVNLAPLLFFLTAQASLQRRQEALREAVSKIDQALDDAEARLPYLSGALGQVDQRTIDAEKEAIKERRVFEVYETRDGKRSGSHYSDYLGLLLSGFPKDVIGGLSGKPFKDISYGYCRAPDYRVSTDFVSHVLHAAIPDFDSLAESAARSTTKIVERGYPELTEVDWTVTKAAVVDLVAAGTPDLRSVLGNHRSMSGEAFDEWFGEMIARHYSEF